MTSLGRVRDADQDEVRAAIHRGGRVLVELWAPWCAQCGPMATVVARFAETLPADVSVLKVNVEEEAVADEYEVSSLPALQLFVDGRCVTSIAGFRRPPALSEQLRRYLT